MNRASFLVAAIVVAAGCSSDDELDRSVPRPAPANSSATADPQLRKALDVAIQQIEKLGDSLVVGNASVAPPSLDAARIQVAALAKTPITASCEHDDWYLFGTAASDNASLKFHAGFAMRRGDTKIYRFGFW